MLNMKKGLAIVLAAATALTFAPVSTLSANAAAGYGNDDGYTYTAGIDSIENGQKSYSIAQGGSAPAAPAYSAGSNSFSYTPNTKETVIKFKEHNDLSNANGQLVRSYRISITKPQTKENGKPKPNDYQYLIAPIPATGTPSDQKHVTDATNDKNKLLTEKNAAWNSNSKNDTATYFIANDAGIKGASEDQQYTVNGADVAFVALNTDLKNIVTNTVTVTVEALGSTVTDATLSETALSTSTFTITVPDNSEQLTLKPKVTTIGEGETVYVPWTVSNHTDINALTVSSDPSGLIDSNIGGDTNVAAAAGTTDKNGVLEITARKAGETTITVYGKKNSKDADKDAVRSASFNLKITPGNGKLRVTYDTAENAGYRGQRLTFTDDNENTQDIATGVVQRDSTTLEVENNTFVRTVDYVKGKDNTHLALTAGGTDYIAKEQHKAGEQTNSVKTTTDPSLGVTDATQFTNTYATGSEPTTSTVYPGTADKYTSAQVTAETAAYAKDVETAQAAVTYAFDNSYILPAARPVVANGQSTVQIVADSDSEANVSYALVAPEFKTDAALFTTGKTVGANTTYDSKNYYYNPVSGNYDGDFDYYSQEADNQAAVKVGSREGKGDSITYTVAAGKKYGAVDNSGLVTLKSSTVDTTLYLVITAKAKNATTDSAARKASTFVVPISTSETQPLQFYAASENGFAELDTETLSADAQNATNAIYLSDDHKSDKLQIVTNIENQSAYVSGDVDDKDDKFTYDNDTKTLSVTDKVKDGDKCNLIIKTNSAPGIAGTETATFKVEYHKNNKNDLALTVNDDAVSKTSPRTKVGRTATEGATVVFDNGLFVKDSATGRYRRVKATENQAISIDVTSTGWVTYYANDGEVYVRAYAKKDGYNPTGYKYAKITYGQHATPNDLTVTEDRVVVKAGESAEVHATASTAISFSVDDTTVATAVSGGAIKVTGVKAGSTTLKVTAAGDSKKGIAEKTIEVPVVVTDANTTPENEVTVPGKVSKIKLYNVKGAKLKINYSKIKGVAGYKVVYKYKKNGKQVRKTYVTTKGSKTVSVPKNTSVKVWVRAYNLNSKGQRVNGSYKTASKKTDKK